MPGGVESATIVSSHPESFEDMPEYFYFIFLQKYNG
jgi:hypothetical protein